MPPRSMCVLPAPRIPVAARTTMTPEPSIVAADNQGIHLPSVKIGCQRLRGQKRIEMMYWPQLCIDDALPGVVGKWGAAVL
jgi:hypothetical protein